MCVCAAVRFWGGGDSDGGRGRGGGGGGGEARLLFRRYGFLASWYPYGAGARLGFVTCENTNELGWVAVMNWDVPPYITSP